MRSSGSGNTCDAAEGGFRCAVRNVKVPVHLLGLEPVMGVFLVTPPTSQTLVVPPDRELDVFHALGCMPVSDDGLAYGWQTRP